MVAAIEVEVRPAPDRLTFGTVAYVRADLYELMEYQAKLNKETVEAQAAVITRLHNILDTLGVRPA